MPSALLNSTPLVLLEVAAHGRAVPVGLVDIGIVGRSDGTAEPRTAGRAGRIGRRSGAAETRKGVRGRPESAGCATVLHPPDEQRVGRGIGCRSDRLRFPSFGSSPQPLVPPHGRHEPAAPIGSEAADVFADEQPFRGARGATGGRTDRVDDGGPTGAVIRRDQEAVGSRDHRRIAANSDAARHHVLPLGTEIGQGPVAPVPAAIGGEPPPVPHGAVPDLPPGTERDRMHEVPGDPAGSRAVPPDLLPGGSTRRQPQHPLSVGADPECTTRVPCGREHVDTPAGRVGQRRERRSRRLDGGRRLRHRRREGQEVPCAPKTGCHRSGLIRSQSTCTCRGRLAAKTTASATSSGRSIPAR